MSHRHIAIYEDDVETETDEARRFAEELQKTGSVPPKQTLKTFFARVKHVLYYGISAGVGAGMVVALLSGVGLVIETVLWNARTLRTLLAASENGNADRLRLGGEWAYDNLVAFVKFKVALFASGVLAAVVIRMGLTEFALYSASPIIAALTTLVFLPVNLLLSDVSASGGAILMGSLASLASMIVMTPLSILGVMRYYPSYAKVLARLARSLIKAGRMGVSGAGEAARALRMKLAAVRG